ncbi:MAG: hypothetical protein GC192_10905 [Bacteroidetes bacterium]|nr:hypothetical protein [Bacteroidota bacterium]
MAKIKKLSIKLPKENASVASVISYCDNVETGMADNADTFPDPVPTLALFTAALVALKASVPSRDEKNTTNTKLMQKNKKDIINNFLKPWADYVLLVANGDRYTAGLSGFVLNVEDTMEHDPSAFTATFKGVGPDGGQAIVEINQRAGNALFIVELKVGDQWEMIDAFNTLKFVVEGLPSGESTLRITGKKGVKKSPKIILSVRAS